MGRNPRFAYFTSIWNRGAVATTHKKATPVIGATMIMPYLVGKDIAVYDSCHRSAVLSDGGLLTRGYALTTGFTPGYVPALLQSYR